jgi:hypothetical protein
MVGAQSGDLTVNIPGNLSGSQNAAYGFISGASLTSGGGNTLLGPYAGYALTTGANNVVIQATTSTDACSTVTTAAASNTVSVCAGAGPVLSITGGGTPSSSAATFPGIVNAGFDFLSAAGSTSAMAFGHTGDITTGVYFPATSQMALCAAGGCPLWVIATTSIYLPNLTTGTNADFLCLTAGKVMVLQSSACTISSLRFKEHVVNFKADALSRISALEVASYNMKPNDRPNPDPNYGTRQIGLIAENIAKVLPECAIYENDMKTPKSYRQECVIAMLVKGEQELMTQNRLLTARLSRVERKPRILRASLH